MNKIYKLKNEYQHKKNQLNFLDNKKEQTIDEWKKYFNKIDNLFYQYGNSPDYLKQDEIAKIVADSMKFYDGKDYELLCYCIMPNHVHFIIKLNKEARLLEDIMHSIKRYSASKANKVLKRAGQFWQHENYDHIIRNEQELENIIDYVLNNPIKAGLIKNQDNWKWNYLKEIKY